MNCEAVGMCLQAGAVLNAETSDFLCLSSVVSSLLSRKFLELSCGYEKRYTQQLLMCVQAMNT
jgi:hypothetical protein